jgi:hypothetical protein
MNSKKPMPIQRPPLTLINSSNALTPTISNSDRKQRQRRELELSRNMMRDVKEMNIKLSSFRDRMIDIISSNKVTVINTSEIKKTIKAPNRTY